jgi:hypothetical protein
MCKKMVGLYDNPIFHLRKEYEKDSLNQNKKKRQRDER